MAPLLVPGARSGMRSLSWAGAVEESVRRGERAQRCAGKVGQEIGEIAQT